MHNSALLVDKALYPTLKTDVLALLVNSWILPVIVMTVMHPVMIALVLWLTNALNATI